MAIHKMSKPDMSGWNTATKLSYRILELTRFPELPRHPKCFKTYEYWPDGAITAEGLPTYGMLRVGSADQLMICLCGGGVSVNTYTAARPGKIGVTEQNFYAVEPIASNLITHFGTYGRSKKNPFRDWSFLCLPYTTGDFHCGRNDFPYTDLQGKQAVLHHHGYENTQLLIEKIKELVPDPKKLIITGFSAGAFGTSLLTDDILKKFPECQDVTVIVDSAIMENDWQPVAREVWKAPDEICNRLNGREIVSDSLIALHEKRPDVKIMFCCSRRDAALTQWVGYLEEDGNWKPTRETGDRFETHLKDMVYRLMEKIPQVSIFIFDTPDKRYEEEEFTTHCICGSGAAFKVAEKGITIAQWMEKGVNGEALQLGLEYLR